MNLLSLALPSSTQIRRAASIAALLWLPTCASLTHIDVSSDGKASIPKATLIDKLLGPLTFTGFDKIDFSQEFKNQGVTKDDVNTVHLKTFSLSIESPVNGSFDFLDSVSFFAESDGLPKVKIASLSALPSGKKQVELDVDESIDLAPYVVAPSMRISGEAQGDRPDEDTVVSAGVVLDVDVHVPGCN